VVARATHFLRFPFVCVGVVGVTDDEAAGVGFVRRCCRIL
jgi:hypothetical protein